MMLYIFKVFLFVRRTLFFHPVFFLLYLLLYFYPFFTVSRKFLSDTELISLLSQGKSLIRIGDGEIGMMTRRGIFFQKFEEGLHAGLRKMVKEYTSESPYLIAIPRKYIDYTNYDLRKEGKLHSWLPFKLMVKLLFPSKELYGDAHMFYFPKTFETKIAPLIKDRPVVFVTSEGTATPLKNNPLWTFETEFIIAKKIDAYDDIDNLRSKVEEKLTKLSERNPILLVSCGPAGKLLAYEFSLLGFQSIDVGTGAEAMYQNIRIDGVV